jgi:hypothetical protein
MVDLPRTSVASVPTPEDGVDVATTPVGTAGGTQRRRRIGAVADRARTEGAGRGRRPEWRREETWPERAAWMWFGALCASVLPLAALAVLAPSTTPDLWARFGHELPATVAADPDALAYVEFIGHWASTGTIGLDLFGLLIAVTAFRRGERWAWLAFWYWPAMFATHFVTYQSAFRYAQLVWLTLSVAALLLTARRVWRPTADQLTPQPEEPRDHEATAT